ncbi:hypothetical protein JBE38_11585 [Pseudomonas sp. ICBG1301]|uniref:hypothetical protein n=1 Tax=Pseudomonas sp. ICBG1301 TaxID=2795987 RepID=UPI000F85E8A5|nr:hypothetical protein [Pseudomonas sp. ICBG1301]MBM9486561.1 hypothetical protein [Pseudomonas sp. ICBG1301]RUQ46975.1 hypothetical protein D8M30_10660 [Corynebacterium pseudodiphtheriticum]
MPGNAEANIVTADVLTLLLYNQYALSAALEEVAVWAKSTGALETHSNAIGALNALDENASAITAGILKLRQ